MTWQPMQLEHAWRVKQSTPSTKSSKLGFATGIGTDWLLDQPARLDEKRNDSARRQKDGVMFGLDEG
jgi:hypothetical protein